MFAHVTRGDHRKALLVLALVSLATLGACYQNPTSPDPAAPLDGHRAAPLDGGIVRQKVLQAAPLDGARNR